MDPRLKWLAEQQDDLVAAWQLVEAGWSRKKIEHQAASRGWRAIHDGVFHLSTAPPTKQQLWRAATLTAPGSFLSHGSAGAAYGFYRFDKPYEVVTRQGRGGRRRLNAVVVCRSTRLLEDATRFNDLPITTAARALIDLAPGLNERPLGRAFREAIRLKRTTTDRIQEALDRHHGRRGISKLRALTKRYTAIPYARTRSDAEGRALEVLHDGNAGRPLVNVKVAGEEADLVWPDRKLIIEIDGPQFHLFADEDARKERAWRDAGYTVRRIGSDDVYDVPRKLLDLAG